MVQSCKNHLYTCTLHAGEPRNLKALYRRGQARMGLSLWRDAAQDLEQAAQLSASDPEQLRLIKERLQVGMMRAFLLESVFVRHCTCGVRLRRTLSREKSSCQSANLSS